MPSRAFSNTRPRFPVVPAIGFALFFGAVLAAACTITTLPPASNQPAAAPSPAPAPAPAPTDPAPVATAAPADAAPAPSASAAYDPCGGKKCGDRCNLCAPKQPGCFETALVKMCHPDGQCKPATAVDCAKPAGG
jgi:hypothetical protein